MTDDKARVRASGTALVPDQEAESRGKKRFIGRRFEQVAPGQWAFVPTGKEEVVARTRTIARALASVDLLAADAETAKWAAALTRKPVTFDPTFGGTAVAKKSNDAGDGGKETKR